MWKGITKVVCLEPARSVNEVSNWSITECKECDGTGVSTTLLPSGGRLVASCIACSGSGWNQTQDTSPGKNARRTCEGKRMWATRAAAMTKCAKYREQGWNSIRAYKCNVCNCWHLTSRRNKRDYNKDNYGDLELSLDA